MINKKEMKNFLITNLSFFTLNFVLFVFILIGIQNNHSKKKVLFLNYESIEMPISFISGSSFIIGSLTGSIIFSIYHYKK